MALDCLRQSRTLQRDFQCDTMKRMNHKASACDSRCTRVLRVEARCGFTLVEVLVVVAIIGVLLGILLPALSMARQCAVVTGELSAGRQFAMAHTMYSGDNRGWVLPGFASAGMVSRGDVRARNDRGQSLGSLGIVAQRYPWRLMPFLGFDRDLLFRDRGTMEEVFRGAPTDYPESEAPRFGLNIAFIGGSANHYALADSRALRDRATNAWGTNWYVARASDAARPSELIVFASAAQNLDQQVIGARFGQFVDGMYQVLPPKWPGLNWAATRPNESTRMNATGQVWFPFAGKTVVTMLDGSAKTLTWDEARDMRRWAPKATSADWSPPPL